MVCAIYFTFFTVSLANQAREKKLDTTIGRRNWKKELDGSDNEGITDLGDLNVEEINKRIWTSILQEQQQNDQTVGEKLTEEGGYKQNTLGGFCFNQRECINYIKYLIYKNL
jgi:hypothetical protein